MTEQKTERDASTAENGGDETADGNRDKEGGENNVAEWE